MFSAPAQSAIGVGFPPWTATRIEACWIARGKDDRARSCPTCLPARFPLNAQTSRRSPARQVDPVHPSLRRKSNRPAIGRPEGLKALIRIRQPSRLERVECAQPQRTLAGLIGRMKHEACAIGRQRRHGHHAATATTQSTKRVLVRRRYLKAQNRAAPPAPARARATTQSQQRQRAQARHRATPFSRDPSATRSAHQRQRALSLHQRTPAHRARCARPPTSWVRSRGSLVRQRRSTRSIAGGVPAAAPTSPARPSGCSPACRTRLRRRTLACQ